MSIDPKQSYQFHTSLVFQQWGLLNGLLVGERAAETLLLDGTALDIPEVIYVARYAGNVSVNPTAYEAITQSHAALTKSLSQGDVIYGVNTGFGGSADLRANDVLALQRVLTRELSYGILPPGARDPCVSNPSKSIKDSKKAGYKAFDLSVEHGTQSQHLPLPWVRAAMLLRLNSLVKGHSGVRPIIVDRLRELLSKNIVPLVPLRGSISASGDLSPIAYISGVLQGKPTIRVFPSALPDSSKSDVYADQALAQAGVEPISLTAKEGLAIVNGTAMSAACATLVLHDIHQLAMLSQILTAMTVEALQGSPESFDAFFSEVRPHPGQIESARNIRGFLRGSQLALLRDGKDGSLRQDRYSIRTAAQWIGPVLEDLVLAHRQMSIECNSATDNPLINDAGQFLHGGNFQAKAVTNAMEKSRQAIQSIGRMLFTQCQEMINPVTSWGLPPNLVADEPNQSGIFKAIDIYISALTSELGFLASPVNHVYNAEQGNQSLNSLALISARYTAVGTSVLGELAAAHVLSACQALDLRAMQLQFLANVKTEFFTRTTSLAKNIQPSILDPNSDLPQTLWSHFLRQLNNTVTMNSPDRFPYIAKSMRVPILDSCSASPSSDILARMDELLSSLGPFLQDAWCINRDAYLVHGDASAVLGAGSRKIYHFVRRALGVPFLCTERILTPTVEAMASGQLDEAPTVGGYTGVVYRAIQRGELIPLMRDLLAEEELVYQIARDL
ncbi:aromatic amino acid ammonia-lyase [Aspergillus affinis]|uniref:aromatic amino acid ammonia-lyase n=1 Tax=Aspergillus affinis TaxID=1070780 RepID=UPI0022FDC262|nr:L-Aspartase-like protein [Aspergillus affinis]KAI9035180.1 L-Aspartase-like protein [Aspergillus affinis]